jgi:hypothetical protein
MPVRPCFLLLLCLCFVSVAQAAPPIPREDPDSDLWGYVDASGEAVIPPRYALATEFTAQGIAAVVDEDGWAWIDTQGTVLLRPFIFDNGPDDFYEGLSRYVENGKIGFFDTSGQVVIPARFTFADPFQGGCAAFCEGCTKVMYGEHYAYQGGAWGCVEHSGAVVTPPSESRDERTPCCGQ